MKAVIFLALLIASAASAEPWSVSERSPVIHSTQKPFVKKQSLWNHRFDYGFAFYQKVISPADGARCGMYPTCAGYGYQAIKKHGPIVGLWLATDRLMRDNGKHMEDYPLILKFGRTRHYDPVSANDFWFSK